MSQYVVSIHPVLGTTGPGSEAHETVVLIDVHGDEVLVRELTLRAPQGAGLTDADTPYVDFELLLKAFVRPRAATGATKTAPATTAPATTRPGSRGLSKPTLAESAKRVGPGRSYRRAPDPSVLASVYEETHSIAGVAEHFGVPIHTAQGWISRLRQKSAATDAAS